MTTVLHVISGLGLGGAERTLVETATGLHHRGLAQYVVSLRGRGPYADDLEAAGIPVSAFDIVSAPRALAVLWSLRQLVRRIKPDIIQGWMYHGDLAALAAHLVARGRSRRRLCWNIRVFVTRSSFAPAVVLPMAGCRRDQFGGGSEFPCGARLSCAPHRHDPERDRLG